MRESLIRAERSGWIFGATRQRKRRRRRVAAVAYRRCLIGKNRSRTVHCTRDDVLHTVHGTFRLKKGIVHYDSLTGNATGLIEIDATSGESGSSARDQRMHKDVLNSSQYRSITFRPPTWRASLIERSKEPLPWMEFSLSMVRITP